MSKKVVLIHTELVAPEKRFIRTDGGLFAVLLIGVLFTVGFGSRLAILVRMDERAMHWTLYGLLFILGIVLSRTRLTSWRYSLTSEGFYVDRVAGKREKPEVEIPLSEIEYAGPFDAARLKSEGRKPGPNVRTGRKEDSLMVLYTHEGRKKAVCITPGKVLRDKLEAPYRTEV